MKKSTSYEIGQSETRANQLVILEAVTSHQKFEGAAPSDYFQFHLPLLYVLPAQHLIIELVIHSGGGVYRLICITSHWSSPRQHPHDIQ